MEVKYIVGRPLTINGEAFEPGDFLEQEHVDAIPRIESYTNARYIYPVISDRDAKRLPGFLRRALNTKVEAEAQLEKNASSVAVIIPDLEKAREDFEGSHVKLTAVSEMKIQDWIYQKNADFTLKPEEETTTDAPKDEEETPEFVPVPVPEPESNEAAGVDQTPAPEEEPDPDDPGPADAETPTGEAPDPDDEQKPETDEAPAEEPAEEPVENTDVPEENLDVFDPAEHSVAEVKDYLKTNPEATEAVLAAEAAGKARKSLLEG